jgi:Bacterial regulatory helix-turn-helix protein, lysR family
LSAGGPSPPDGRGHSSLSPRRATSAGPLRRLHIAQPPLSRQIRGLEEELGTALFTRTPRGMRLLPAGAAFLDPARAILAQLEAAVAAVRRHQAGPPGGGHRQQRKPMLGSVLSRIAFCSVPSHRSAAGWEAREPPRIEHVDPLQEFSHSATLPLML